MAYYDYNGRITIDEEAAGRDIQRLRAALPALENAAAVFGRLAQEGRQMQGETGKAAADKAEELLRKVRQVEELLRETETLIEQTVRRYQRLDREVKEAIEAARLDGK